MPLGRQPSVPCPPDRLTPGRWSIRAFPMRTAVFDCFRLAKLPRHSEAKPLEICQQTAKGLRSKGGFSALVARLAQWKSTSFTRKGWEVPKPLSCRILPKVYVSMLTFVLTLCQNGTVGIGSLFV